ncbi:MAG: DUF4340 domain-containing protein [Bacteroidales bacterium]|nr:DUF4340 domain-containing protein [Bacteroidales bacterium]
MKKNRNLIIIVVFLLVVAIAILLSRRSGTLNERTSGFAVKDTASVTKVFLADKNNRTILLEREPDGSWQLNNTYLARQSGINMLLETVYHLTPKYPVPKKAHDNIIAQLAARSVKVEIYQQVYRIDLFDRIKLFEHEKLTKVFYVGGATQDNMGTFMLMEGASVPYVVHLLGFRGYLAPRFSTMEKEWRDHTVFKTKLADIKSVKLEMPDEPENSFEVKAKDRSLSLIRLQTGEEVPAFDTLKLLNFMTSFADLRYEALLDDIEPGRKDSIISSTPYMVITLTDKNDYVTRIKTFRKPNDVMKFDMAGNLYVNDLDRAYALINDGRDFVLIQYYVFDKVLRPLSFFIRD